METSATHNQEDHHANGDGKVDSCSNTISSVGDVLRSGDHPDENAGFERQGAYVETGKFFETWAANTANEVGNAKGY